MVDRQLREGVAFMNANGLLHFDRHIQTYSPTGTRSISPTSG
jgi:hypothetical protein